MKKYNISHEYNIDLWNRGVCEEDEKGKDCVYAVLNVMRAKIADKLGISSNFQLSTGYVKFFLLYRKSGDFLASVINGADPAKLEDVSLDCTPMQVLEICEKYGAVPLNSMPDNSHHHKTDVLIVLNNRLRLGAMQLKQGTADFKSIMAEVLAVLADGIGEPPEEINFTYRKADGEIAKLSASPADFYSGYCGMRAEDYSLVSAYNSDAQVSADVLMRLVSRQLEGGEQVAFGCDERQQSMQMLGILDTDFIDAEDSFGTDVRMSREDKLSYGVTRLTRYMTFDGVQLENGRAVRFKVQDCRGAETGADGHYTMSADWFCQYVLSALIRRELTESASDES